MSNLNRKQILISAENAAKLAALSKNKSVSESEVIRRAIEAYDPESGREQEAEAMLANVETALDAALQAVERANTQVEDTLTRLSDPGHRNAAIEAARRELDAHPGLARELALGLGYTESMA
jgi:predicted DNA-binding protein